MWHYTLPSLCLREGLLLNVEFIDWLDQLARELSHVTCPGFRCSLKFVWLRILFEGLYRCGWVLGHCQDLSHLSSFLLHVWTVPWFFSPKEMPLLAFTETVSQAQKEQNAFLKITIYKQLWVMGGLCVTGQRFQFLLVWQCSLILSWYLGRDWVWDEPTHHGYDTWVRDCIGCAYLLWLLGSAVSQAGGAGFQGTPALLPVCPVRLQGIHLVGVLLLRLWCHHHRLLFYT